jgi:hypothetical protein
MASWLASFFTGEYEGKALQRSGPVTREQLVQWFEAGRQLFASPDFKMALLQVGRPDEKEPRSQHFKLVVDLCVPNRHGVVAGLSEGPECTEPH